MMSTILAPTRGGEHSFPNQDLAIEMAKERGAQLVFLYVTDVRFVSHLPPAYARNLERDLADMGEFLLTMAAERADKGGIQAQTVVRRGHFGQTLRELIRELEAHTVLIGTPTQGTGKTNRDYLDKLISTLIDELGVEVILADNGEIVDRRSPLTNGDESQPA